MRRHTSFGWEILSEAKSPLLRLAAEIALAHHERFDGRGYPRGLKGGKIPLAARIVAVADVFDALTVERAYKRAWSFEESARYIFKERGRQFDPKVVAAFRRALGPLRQAWKERGPRAAPGPR